MPAGTRTGCSAQWRCRWLSSSAPKRSNTRAPITVGDNLLKIPRGLSELATILVVDGDSGGNRPTLERAVQESGANFCFPADTTTLRRGHQGWLWGHDLPSLSIGLSASYAGIWVTTD